MRNERQNKAPSASAGTGLSDHDLLIRIDERLDGVEMALKNHLHHHWWITVAALAAATGAILTALMRAL